MYVWDCDFFQFPLKLTIDEAQIFAFQFWCLCVWTTGQQSRVWHDKHVVMHVVMLLVRADKLVFYQQLLMASSRFQPHNFRELLAFL